MKVVYGTQTFEITPTKADWKSRTALGKNKSRSDALTRVDNAFDNLESNPTVANFTALQTAFNTWYNSKTATGTFQSERGIEPIHVRQMLNKHQQLLTDRQQLMQDVETALTALNWKTKAIHAEIYDSAKAARFGPLQTYVPHLEWESIINSGWAKNPPSTVNEWSDAGRLGILMQSRMSGAINIAPNTWPQWAPSNYARKGLFCHSCAAISANIIYTDRATLQGNLQCPIRSIELVHQQPAQVGQISHWWLCVNRPDEIQLENRTVRFDTFQDYATYLPMVGGFVVDLWGAMFIVSSNQQSNAHSQAALGNNCAWDGPDQNFLGPTFPRVHARWANPLA